MNTIEFENKNIQGIHDFLTEISLKGRTARSRSLLCKRLVEKFTERSEQRTEIQKNYGKLNESGELVTDENGVVQFENEDKKRLCISEIDEHDKELAVINCTEIMNHMETLLEALNELDEELSGTKAYAYDLVCEQLENLKFENEGE